MTIDTLLDELIGVAHNQCQVEGCTEEECADLKARLAEKRAAIVAEFERLEKTRSNMLDVIARNTTEITKLKMMTPERRHED